MHTTQIGIFKIAQTRVNWKEVFKWLGFLGVQQVPSAIYNAGEMGISEAGRFFEPRDRVATDASSLVALCGKRCYNSFEVGLNPNISKIRTDHSEYITNVLKSGHGSVLEHATWSFAIENVSRVFTGEMNRHRAGVAISEASMRYIRFDDIGFTMPESLELNPSDEMENELIGELGCDTEEENTIREEGDSFKKVSTQRIFQDAFTQMEKWNIDLCNIWKIEEMKDFAQKKALTSMFRRIIGMGVATGGVWTINARAMRHIMERRAEYGVAEEEIYYVWDHIANTMVTEEPLLFGDFTKNDNGSWVPKYPKV
jgi:thymidylate synthase (FAD)